MKQLAIFLMSLSFLSYGQTSNYMCLNWGLMKIGDTIMVDEAEISVGEWLDYISYYEISNYPSYLNRQLLTENEKKLLITTPFDSSLLPSSIILNKYPFNFLFSKPKKCGVIKFSSLSCNVYLPVDADSLKNSRSKKRICDYLKMPIVGISYEQTIKFCQWRTSIDSLRFYNPPEPLILGQLRIQKLNGTAYIYRLPTPQEFDILNPAHDSIYNKKGIITRFNYKNSIYCSKDKTNSCGKAPVDVYTFPSSVKSVISGTKNMQGNVAEMTTIKGIAKGGSYYHYAKESYPGFNNIYEGPQSWLGFRCVGLPRQK